MRRLLALIGVLALAGACGGASGSALPSVETIGGGGATSTSVPSNVAPLTGLKLFNPEIAARPAVMIKIGDDVKARPQAGLDKADVIYEERVEGNTVRFLAVFQSQDATSVGPIRSVRSTDTGVVGAIGGVFVYSGGIPPFDALVRRQDVQVISEEVNPGAFKLRGDRQRPYKTYASTSSMRTEAGKASRPPALFRFLDEGETLVIPGASQASQVTVRFGPGTVTRWDWDPAAARWKRFINGSPQRADGGGQVSFTNVIVQKVPYRGTPYTDQSGSPVDEAVTVGSGEATLFAGGQSVPLRWAKSSDKAVTTFTDSSGTSVRLTPGQTWVVLAPVDAAVEVVNPTAGTATTPSRVGISDG